jgi:chemotaxis protein methyltransferase CheR
MKAEEIAEIEMKLMLEAVQQVYGYDFRNYAKASLKRRVSGFLKSTGLEHYSRLQENLLYDKELFNRFLLEMSITVTEMFRDPAFYKDFRERVVPVLKTYPYVKIWHAGCATGEEVYSMAILLEEEGFLDKATIYATDFNNSALARAKEGIYSPEAVKKYSRNYQLAGGKASFSDYYQANYGAVKIRSSLKKNITWANHNLAVDKVFGEMNLVVCRNVVIYFDSTLQDRVFELFRDSLCHRGFLCLGSKETLSYSTVVNDFEVFSKKERIYRKT